jgi:hypothetical protein
VAAQVYYVKDLEKTRDGVVPSVVPTCEDNRSADLVGSLDGPGIDSDLVKVVRAWGWLPEHVKQAILTLAQVAKG